MKKKERGWKRRSWYIGKGIFLESLNPRHAARNFFVIRFTDHVLQSAQIHSFQPFEVRRALEGLPRSLGACSLPPLM